MWSDGCVPVLAISVFLMLLMTCELIPGVVSAPAEYWDYAVIGAGPAGLQMGYHLQKAGRQYVIMERSNISGKDLHAALVKLSVKVVNRTLMGLHFRQFCRQQRRLLELFQQKNM